MKQLLGAFRGANSNNQQFVFSIMEGRIYRIGRDESSDIRIDIDNLICDTHCLISSTPDSLNSVPNVYLTDISTTYTFLNGCSIGQNNTVLLYSGCIISFASKHINLQYIQCTDDYEQFDAFTMTVQPGYLFSPTQQVVASSEISIKATNKDIGYGNQSFIKLAYNKENPARQLACKYTNVKRSYIKNLRMKAYETELNILKNNKHPNVLSLVALHEDQHHKFVFLPLYHGGSLQDRLDDPSMSGLDERNAIFLMKQLFAGLDYLHDKGIIHCDIKPSNILLAARYTDAPRLVIADFGISMIKAHKPDTWPEDWGTLTYHSPEMIQLQEFSDKVDSWAAGIIFYQLFAWAHPFSGYEDRLKEAIVMEEIELSSAVFMKISPSSKQIIGQLTHKDQHQRATIKQVMGKLLCSWFNGDAKAANDHYLREREWWFGEVERPLSSASKSFKHNRIHTNYDDQPEAVEMIKEFRDPTHADTFLSISPSVREVEDISLYPLVERRARPFRKSRNYL